MQQVAHCPFFFFNDTATTEIYTLSLHDALPIYIREDMRPVVREHRINYERELKRRHVPRDRKSTRLNSSHLVISYAVFCLKKKKNTQTPRTFAPYWVLRTTSASSKPLAPEAPAT